MRVRVLIAVAAALTVTSSAAAQQITGRVVDASTREPIAGVTLRLTRGATEAGSSVSDSAGRFQIQAAAPGRYRLTALRLGYADLRSDEIELERDSVVTLDLALQGQALDVEPVTVNATRDPYLQARGFYERRQAGTGDFMTADQIRRRNAQTLVDLLRGMRGVKIQRVNWKQEVYFAGANCLPQVNIDGITVRYGGRTVRASSPQSIEDLVNVSHIRGVEVYRGSSGVPIEFEGPNAACGVIVVWTAVR